MKKYLALILILMFSVAMSLSAFADHGETNDESGHEVDEELLEEVIVDGETDPELVDGDNHVDYDEENLDPNVEVQEKVENEVTNDLTNGEVLDENTAPVMDENGEIVMNEDLIVTEPLAAGEPGEPVPMEVNPQEFEHLEIDPENVDPANAQEPLEECRQTEEELVLCMGMVDYAGQRVSGFEARIAQLESYITEMGLDVPEASEEIAILMAEKPEGEFIDENIEPVVLSEDEFNQEVGFVKKIFAWFNN